jgi:hypothetical protein
MAEGHAVNGGKLLICAIQSNAVVSFSVATSYWSWATALL